jgi:hypothetical protein
MMSYNGMRSMMGVVAVAAVSTLAGCMGQGDDQAGEDVSMVSSALGAQQCAPASVPTDVFATGSINYLSPQTYSNPPCIGALVGQLNALSSPFTFTGTASNAGLRVSYADSDLTTAFACHDAAVDAILYRQVGAGWVTVTPSRFADNGAWVAGPFGSFCSPPFIFFDGPSLLTAGATNRIAFRASRFSSGLTRKVRLTTVNAVNNPK